MKRGQARASLRAGTMHGSNGPADPRPTSQATVSRDRPFCGDKLGPKHVLEMPSFLELATIQLSSLSRDARHNRSADPQLPHSVKADQTFGEERGSETADNLATCHTT